MSLKKCFYIFALCILAVILLPGCASTPGTALPAPAASLTAPTLRDRVDLQPYFEGFSGAFVFDDLKNDSYIRYNSEQCAERLLPASTFKIMNSLIALETGVIPDENYVIEWDGTQHEIASWNQDHTLKTAIQDSVVWYYQELARRVGREKMQQYIDAVGYGNQDIRGPIDVFWLDGSLKISADEQVEFLKRLYQGDLPFSERSTKIVRDILALEKTDTYLLRGKTGSGQVDGVYTGWFVGYVEKEGNAYFFATNLQAAHPNAQGTEAKKIALSILQEFELLP